MNVKKITSIILCLVMLAALLSGCGTAEKKSSDNGASQSAATPYVIGLDLDVTGAGSALGVPERDSVKMLVQEINSTGGINGHQIKLVEADNESDETKSRLTARRLITEEKVLAIIGTSQSTTSIPIAEVAEREQVPVITMGSSDAIVKDRKWAFKAPTSSNLLLGMLIQEAAKVGVKKMAFISVNNAYGDSGLAAYKQEIAKTSIKPIFETKFPATTTDMSVELLDAKKSGADGVIVWAVMPAIGIANRDFARLGLQDQGMKLFSNSTMGDPVFLEAAGKEAAKAGTLFINYKMLVAEQLPDNDTSKPVNMDFINLYENKYKVGKRVTYGANAHDAFYILLNAIKDSGIKPDGDLAANRTAIRDAIEKESYLGILGNYKFSPDNHRGADVAGYVINKIGIENGQPVFKLAE